MTEREWFSAKTIIDLDLWRSAKNQHRKWRLFAAACCQRAVTLVADPRLQPLVEAIEQFADGVIDWTQMKTARKILTPIEKEIGDPFGPQESLQDALTALRKASEQKPVSALGACQDAEWAYGALGRNSRKKNEMDRLRKIEEKLQLQLAYDIFGNPFRPVAFDPAWRTSTAVGVAQAMYDAREFGAMPILADALQDAGCEDEMILRHCRDEAQVHVRGCWVVDLVLGKT